MEMQLPELNFKPKLRVINDDQIMQIHMATLEVLERTGVKMTHPRGVELLDGTGASMEGDRHPRASGPRQPPLPAPSYREVRNPWPRSNIQYLSST